MSRKSKKKNESKILYIIFVITLILLAALYYRDHKAEVDSYLKKQITAVENTVNDTLMELNLTGIENAENEVPSENTDQNKVQSPEIPVNHEITDIEVPLCKKGALFISDGNTKGVLETPEKEDTHQIIVHNGFTLCYREKYEQPEWVCYTLDASKVQKNVNRKDNFRADPLVLTGSAELSDYKGTGYDRGHLCPSADLTYSAETMDESFVLSNMSPQAAKFNRGMWKDLEQEVRNLTAHYDILYIATGPVLEKDDYPSVGKNEVSVPEYYYKAILGIKDGKYYAIGFILPNTACEGTIWDYAVSIDEVEKRTSVDFFYNLDDDAENIVEGSCQISDWKF